MLNHTQCPISEMGFDQRFGQYHLSVKIGNYQTFNSFQHSNQHHHHDSFELVLILEGAGSFRYKGQTHILEAGDLFLSDPYSEHEIHINPSEHLKVFYLFMKITDLKPKSYPAPQESLIKTFMDSHKHYAKRHPELLAHLNFIHDYSKLAKTTKTRPVSEQVYSLILDCMSRLSVDKLPSKDRMNIHHVNTFEWLLDYIDQNLEHKLTAASLAQAYGVSKATVYNLFRKHMDCTVHAYIRERKIELAKHYLMMAIPVSEVAGLMGYDSLPQFSRTFKEVVGICPKTFMKQQSDYVPGIGRRLTRDQSR